MALNLSKKEKVRRAIEQVIGILENGLRKKI